MNRQKFQVFTYLALLVPFDCFVGLALLLTESLGRILDTVYGRRPPGTHKLGALQGNRDPSVTIIVVSWEGRHLLEESLPPLVDAVGEAAEILIVDNGSHDGSAEFVRQRFPKVRVLSLDRNYGFTGGNNRGVQEAQSDIVIFLNNDMIVDRDFLKPLLDGFSDPSVFAVTSQIFLSDPFSPRLETGNACARFDRGFFSLAHRSIESSDRVPVFWAGGGSSAVDRVKFLEIGGFDPLYHPFYVEDMDLSYQAWKRGWKSVLAPASRVIHKHRGTSRPKFGNDFVDNTIRRNQYLFIWKNVTDLSMLLEHILNLPRIHGKAMLEGQPHSEFRAYFRALRKLPHALWKRMAGRSSLVLSDRQVLSKSQNA